MCSRASVLALAWVAAACTSSDVPDSGVRDSAPVDVGALDAEPRDASDAGTIPPRNPDATLVFHDAGAPAPCTETCDCPQGLACLEGRCRNLGANPVWCCDHSGCPTGEICLGRDDRPSTCPAPRPDAGPLPDTGPRDGGVPPVGAACAVDDDCDPASGLTCWTQEEPPYLWDGYCTVKECSPSCPPGSGCVAFNTGTDVIRGCMALCTSDEECRADAFCRDLGGQTSVCFPRCRDDLYDCAPRNGSMYCSPESGACEPTPSHTSAPVGSACTTAIDCGAGQVCLSEGVWFFAGGMCTKVCSGLPEQAPCELGETCQDFAGIGLCFKNCDSSMTCPDRPTAFCGTLYEEWVTPVCLPF
ncbi:MAG: hypothetical protein HYV07_02515 [Deltaproteobacteria bacterium]|nr:hypothetical protein [Deltaproteobacteria bacterium]